MKEEKKNSIGVSICVLCVKEIEEERIEMICGENKSRVNMHMKQ